MPTHGRLAVRAVEETLDFVSATDRIARLMRETIADGRVTAEEIRSVLEAIDRAQAEGREALAAVENTEIGERIALAGLTGAVPTHLVRQAAERGLSVLVLHPTVADPLPLDGPSGEVA